MARPKNPRGGRPRIAAEQLRTATIGVRVSPAEYAALREKAAAMGMTPAQWLRRAALDRQLPRPAAQPVNLDTYRELARLGVNLNQIRAKINAGIAVGIPQEVIAGLFQAVLMVQRQVIGGGADDSQPE